LIRETDRVASGWPADQAREELTEVCLINTDSVLSSWWQLAALLVAKYSDGYINLPDGHYSTPGIDPIRMIGYPADWLMNTDYGWGPVSYEMK